jgi:hypothetical protein
MKSFIFIFILSLLLSVKIYGQKVVLDASEIPENLPVRYIPDTEGKVLIDMRFLESNQLSRDDDTVTVYPNWPVTEAGSTERGGVYGNLDNDPELELVYTIGNLVYGFNMDGTVVGGWPRELDYPTDGAPAFGDVDGDGFGEIVVTTHQTSTFASGTVYAFEINGTNMPGFPVSMEGGPLRTPVLADIDDDGKYEIILAIRKWPEGFIHIYRSNGTMYPNFPVRMEYTPGSAVAVGDITGDEIPEIIAESYYTLHVFNLEGVILPGFPYYPGENRVFSYSSPVLADIDGDGLREIICGDHSTDVGDGAVHIVKSDGTSYPGWPQYTSYWIYGPPSVGDINGDGELDIAVGDQVISPSPVNKAYAWTATTGIPLEGFPITGLNGINSQIILADLDDDEMVELIMDDNTATNSMGRYHGYNHDGTILDDWPLETLGSTFFINPLVVDINLDGILDVSGGGTEQETGSTNIYLWNSNKEYNPDFAILPILQYNTRHSGVYGDYLMVGMEEAETSEEFEIEVFPNPASWLLAVGSWQLDKSQRSAVSGQRSAVRIIFYDMSGREMLELLDVSSSPFIIDISGLNPGIYILKLIFENGSVANAKFVKIHD